jgi:hypothetical protein
MCEKQVNEEKLKKILRKILRKWNNLLKIKNNHENSTKNKKHVIIL